RPVLVGVAAHGAGAAAALLGGAGRLGRGLSTAGAVVGAGASLLLGLDALVTRGTWTFEAPSLLAVGGGLLLRRDTLGAFFLILIGMVAAPAALYGAGYSAAHA